jgi:hypothetical protein
LEESTDEASNSSSRLASYFIKALLFVGLFLLAVLFVSTYPFPMTDEHMRWWSAFSAKFGIRDPRGSWVSLTLGVDLIVAALVYLALAKRVEALASEISTTPSGLVRGLVKALLFAVLFLLAVRYIHTPMTDEYTRWWLAAADTFGVHGIEDFEDFELTVTLFVDLIVTVIVYTVITQRWRIFRAKRRSSPRA